jgi:asparagine synthase (glutamine-hydrolysing)
MNQHEGAGPGPDRSEAAGADANAGDGEMAGWAARLSAELEGALGRALEGTDEAGIAFSGGVDSSLVALLAGRRGTELRLYTAGLHGARDLEASERAAAALGLGERLVVLELSEDEALEAAARVVSVLQGATLLEVSFLAPAFIVFERARERRILTGDGADELFGGYHRYLSMEPDRLAASLEKDARELASGGFERNRRLAASAGRAIAAPYLDPRVIGLAQNIPARLKVHGGQRKAVLRRAAAILGLPPELCAMPKRAAQYGSGIHALLTKKRFMQ